MLQERALRSPGAVAHRFVAEDETAPRLAAIVEDTGSNAVLTSSDIMPFCEQPVARRQAVRDGSGRRRASTTGESP
ncbi:hypothetical protein [Streptomyces sp. 5-6(2022)]|uniref:hypothetical protein n=1 Tax=Streptomyces sp. 5-6(2022) TaxID=2936510 RepID=UPI0023B97DF7|nr:hypothetical protein [Streptomyces sp. 5-6(2022)]